MKHAESKLQQACVKWFDYQYPQYRLNLFAIPNGGRRGKIEAAIMNGEGVRSGVADLFLAVPNSNFHGLFIEMKSENGRQNENQKLFEKAISGNYAYILVSSFDQFKATIEGYLKIYPPQNQPFIKID